MVRRAASSAVRLLEELIALPSVNPAFSNGQRSLEGEERVARFIADRAAKAGLECEFVAVAPGRPNVLVRLAPPGRARRRLILAPHLDTVGASRLDERLFSPRARNGRIHGRGACDTKGSVAAMLTALFGLAESPARPRETEILFAGLADEENGQQGSRAFARSKIKADLAIVGEPTRLGVVTAHKGDLWLEIQTRGRSAHGAMPHLGENAIHKMSPVIEWLEGDYAAALRRKRHEVLGCPTVSVGTISGGTQPNVVPEFCRISLDRRTLPGESEAAVRREIRSSLRRHGIRARILNLRPGPCPALETDPALPWVAQFMRLARQRRLLGVHYFCDAAILARGGIPSVVFGPGDIAQAHTEDEWIAIDSLERGCRLLRRFIESLP